MSLLTFHSISANDKYQDILIKKILSKESFKYKNYSFLNAFKRAIYINQESYPSSYHFYEDLINKKLKKKYFLDSYYFYNIIKIFFSSHIKKIKIKTSLRNRYLVNLNILTKILFKILICWQINYDFDSSKKKNRKTIFFNSKDEFSKNIYKKNLQKHLNKYQLLTIKNKLSFFDKIKIFLRNIKICIFNSYPTNNYHTLYLFMKYDIFESLTQNLKIHAGIFFEGDGPDDDIMSGYLRSKNIKTYLFQQGTYTGNTVPVFLKNLNYDYFFCWGDFFKKKIKKFNPNTKIISLGRIGRNFVKIKKKKNIIFADQASPENGKMKKIKNEFYEFCKWCILNFKNYKIILKPHPKHEIDNSIYGLKKYKNFSIFNKKKDITILLQDAEFLVSVSSTTLVDALAYKVFPICFMSNLSLQPDFRRNKIGFFAKSSQQAKFFFDNYFKKTKNFKKISNTNDMSYYIKSNFDNNFKKIIRKKII